jgi:hypothetical protein
MKNYAQWVILYYLPNLEVTGTNGTNGCGCRRCAPRMFALRTMILRAGGGEVFHEAEYADISTFAVPDHAAGPLQNEIVMYRDKPGPGERPLLISRGFAEATLMCDRPRNSLARCTWPTARRTRLGLKIGRLAWNCLRDVNIGGWFEKADVGLPSEIWDDGGSAGHGRFSGYWPLRVRSRSHPGRSSRRAYYKSSSSPLPYDPVCASSSILSSSSSSHPVILSILVPLFLHTCRYPRRP